MKFKKPELPLHITLLYLLFGGLWIFLSDQILFRFVFLGAQEPIFQTFKGWFFILTSGSLLYLLLRANHIGQKQRQEDLQTSQAQMTGMIHSAMDAIITTDADQRIVIFNPAAEVMFRCSQSEALGQLLERFIPHRFRIAHREYIQTFAQTGATNRTMSHLGNLYGLRNDGEEFPIEASISRTNIADKPLLTVILRDVTKRKQAEQQSLHLKRLYATLSEVNQTIVRVKSHQELFESICKVAIEFGEFRLAWIGLYDQETGQVTPVAEHGAGENKLPFPNISIKEPPFQEGLISQALQSGTAQFSSDIQTDPHMTYWQKIAARDGYHSAAAVPIRQNGQIIGSLNIYAAEIGFFIVKDEQDLLKEIGLDISFALDLIQKEAERKRAEEEVQSRSQQLAALLHASQSLTESLNLLEVLQKITDKAKDVLGVDTTAIYLAQGEHLYLGAATPSLPAEFPETFRRTILSEHPHIAEALATEEIVILSDTTSAVLTTAERIVSDTLGLRSIIYIPLVVRKDTVGVLILGTVGQPRDFSRNDKDVARAFSNQATLAIANAKLYEDLTRYVEELENQINERKQAQEALIKSEERFRLLFENNRTIMMLIEPISGIIKNANKAAAQFYGYSLSELRGMNINDINTLTPDEVYAERMRAVKEERNYFNFQHRLSNGKIRSVEVHSAPVKVGEETLLFSIIYDITDRRQAEEKVRRHIGYLTGLREVDQAIASSFDLRLSLNIITSRAVPLLNVDAAAILLLDPIMNSLEYAAGHGFQKHVLHTGNVRLGESYAGKAVMERRMIRVPNLAAELYGQLHNQFLKEEKFVSYYGIPLIVKGKVVGVMEVFHRTLVERDQEWFDFLDSLAGQAAIAIDNARLWEQVQRHARDLELRVAERTAALNRTNAELERANRAKDEFLANMSHELRTPLNSILGLSESLLEQRRDPLTEFQQQSLQIISSSGHHLLELINDVLDLSKIEAGKFDYYPQTIDVNSLCRSSLSFVKSLAARKSITINYNNEASVSSLVADPRRLKQILVNLLTNAVKFTPDRGEVTLQVCSDAEREWIQFSVIDNGIGIAPHDLKRLFQPFVQVDSRLNRQFEGTGLGLALVQKLTDLHGGSVEVESEVGMGSRFMVNLPWKQESKASQKPIEADGEPISSEGIQEFLIPVEERLARGVILLAEDNISNVQTIGQYLESHGFITVKAYDGLEAIEKAEASDPSIILMDIQMPVMDGLESIRRLRVNPRFVRTPIIAITALTMPGDRERCLEAGANEYMSKPVRLKGLLKLIQSLSSQGKQTTGQ